MKLHDLAPPKGSTHAKRRVGRGTGGKGGKTAGRGTKGQKARTQIPAGFEGGQQPILARAPKLRGFTNPFRVVLHARQPRVDRRARPRHGRPRQSSWPTASRARATS